MSNYLSTTKEQIQALVQADIKGPFHMINLLRFKREKDENGDDGKAIYKQYMQAAAPFIEQAKAKIVYFGACHLTIIGPEEEWDELLIVEYPDKNSFLNMAMHKEYPAELRKKALEDSRLILSTK